MHKTLMVDMDNVITDTIFFEIVCEFLNCDIDKGTIPHVYSLQTLIPKNKERRFWEYAKTRNFYEGAPLIEGAYEALRELNDLYDLYIVTSYLWISGICDVSADNLRNKYLYLKSTLPFISPEKYIFSSNKRLMRFDVGIDDRVCNLASCETKLLFTQWHNVDIAHEELDLMGVVRVGSWSDVMLALKSDACLG